MARMEKQSKPLTSTAAEQPVWTTQISDPPVRHPSRPKMAYRPRGCVKPEFVTLWGTDVVAGSAHIATVQPILQRHAPVQLSRESQSRRKPIIYAAGISILCSGVVLGGYGLFENANSTVAVNAVEAPARIVAQVVSPALAPVVIERIGRTDLTTGDVSPVVMSTPVLPFPKADMRQAFVFPRQPVVGDRAPVFENRISFLPAPVITTVAGQAPVRSALPRPLAVAPSYVPFVCPDCVPIVPRFDDITIALHSGRADAATPAADLRDLRARDVQLVATQIAFGTNQVRFYRSEDTRPAQFLAARYGAELVDLTWFTPDSAAAKIDLFVAATLDSD